MCFIPWYSHLGRHSKWTCKNKSWNYYIRSHFYEIRLNMLQWIQSWPSRMFKIVLIYPLGLGAWMEMKLSWTWSCLPKSWRRTCLQIKLSFCSSLATWSTNVSTNAVRLIGRPFLSTATFSFISFCCTKADNFGWTFISVWMWNLYYCSCAYKNILITWSLKFSRPLASS